MNLLTESDVIVKFGLFFSFYILLANFGLLADEHVGYRDYTRKWPKWSQGVTERSLSITNGLKMNKINTKSTNR